MAAAIWESYGAGIVEGDEMGKKALERDPELRKALAVRFGAGILDAAGKIRRPELAEIAFATEENQRDLTRITFPSLYRLAQEELWRLAGICPAVVFDAALIFEWGVERDFDYIVAVTAPEKKMLLRAAARMRISVGEAEKRLKRQLPAAEKARRADYHIINDGAEEHLEERAREVWEDILVRGRKSQ